MNKKLNFSVLLVCILAFVMFFTFGCSGGNSLNGTWASEGYQENYITFSGKKFSYGSYQYGNGRSWLDRRLSESTDGTFSISGDKIEMSFSDGEVKLFNFSRTSDFTIRIDGNELRQKK